MAATPMPRFHPDGRDHGVAKVTKITIAVVTASTAATLGLGAAIATAAPPPKAAKEKTDFPDDKAAKPPKAPTRVNQPQPPAEKPESSIGDEQTTTGGS